MIEQKRFFEGLDFEKVEISGQTLYRGVEGAYFRMDQRKSYIAIEAANTEDEARHNIFEDADLFEFAITGPEEVTFELIRKELELHYAANAPVPY